MRWAALKIAVTMYGVKMQSIDYLAHVQDDTGLGRGEPSGDLLQTLHGFTYPGESR